MIQLIACMLAAYVADPVQIWSALLLCLSDICWIKLLLGLRVIRLHETLPMFRCQKVYQEKVAFLLSVVIYTSRPSCLKVKTISQLKFLVMLLMNIVVRWMFSCFISTLTFFVLLLTVKLVTSLPYRRNCYLLHEGDWNTLCTMFIFTLSFLTDCYAYCPFNTCDECAFPWGMKYW